ncbi:hypothetical protein HT031_005052 [Scenedesmus sp. PABB004]|nr:hypothetical protein HT031_005052 [Scenedesmus sp. PABB004]
MAAPDTGYTCNCTAAFVWDPISKSCLPAALEGFYNPDTYKVMQTCQTAACQGWVKSGERNIYSVPADTPNVPAWRPNYRANTTNGQEFALETTGPNCVDICNSAPCGSAQGNIIQYGGQQLLQLYRRCLHGAV